MCEVTPYMANTALVRFHLVLFSPSRLPNTFQLYSNIEQSPFRAGINNVVHCLPKVQYKKRLSVYILTLKAWYIIKYSTVLSIYY